MSARHPASAATPAAAGPRRRWLRAAAALPLAAGLQGLPGRAAAQPPAGAASSAGTAASAGRAPAAPPDAAAFARRLRERERRDLVGIAAAQVGPWGRRIHLLGRRREDAPAPVEEHTVFELGSLTKAFVALALADGVLAGRWRLDDPVEDSLPDGVRLRDSKGQPVRLIDLATHRSGLPRMPGDLGPREIAMPYAGYTEARLWRFLRGWRAGVPRDTRFEYSNLGYGVLSLALARREGRRLEALLDERVFAPLGLQGLQIRRPTYAGDDPQRMAATVTALLQAPPRDATGHDAARRPAPAWEFDALAGAVGLVGPIGPVAGFMEAALGLRPHPLAEAFALCLRQRGPGEHPLHPFGLAWELSSIAGPRDTRWLFNQDGTTAGHSCSLWLEPGRRRGAAVLANSFASTRELALSGLDAGITERDFSLVHVRPELLRAYVGRYRLPRGDWLELVVDDARLWLRSPGGAAVELVSRMPLRFVARDRLLEVEFDDLPPRSLTLLVDGLETGPRFEREF